MNFPLIPLSDVPEHFFDQEKWTKILSDGASIGKDRNEILSSIFVEGAGWLEYYCRAAAKTGNAHAQIAAGIYEAFHKLLTAFLDRLKSGDLEAKGYLPNSTFAQVIPANFWANLKLNMVKNDARSETHHFTNIEVTQRSPKQDPMFDRCLDWLKSQPSDPNIKETTLWELAKEHFGKSLSRATFNAVYKFAFRRPRGRPRKVDL